MPEPTHPPYVSGALTTPRFLSRWLDINPQNGRLTRTQTFTQVPVFDINHVWNGYSEIVGEYHFSSPNNLSFKLSNLADVIPSNTNYTLCVSYVVSQGHVVRYSLIRSADDLFYFELPEYNGQFIAKEFALEVWNTSQVACSETVSPTFYTSVLGDLDYRYGVDSALASTVQLCSSQQPPGTTTLYPPGTNLELWLDGGIGWTTPAWTDRQFGTVFNSDTELQSNVSPNLVSMNGSVYSGGTGNPVSTWMFLQLGFDKDYAFFLITNGVNTSEVGIDVNGYTYVLTNSVTLSTGTTVLTQGKEYVVVFDSTQLLCNVYNAGTFELVDSVACTSPNLQSVSTIRIGTDGSDLSVRAILCYNDTTINNGFYTFTLIPYMQSLPAGAQVMTIPLVFDPCSTNPNPPDNSVVIGIG